MADFRVAWPSIPPRIPQRIPETGKGVGKGVGLGREGGRQGGRGIVCPLKDRMTFVFDAVVATAVRVIRGLI